MYAYDSGRRLSDSQTNGGSSGVYRSGTQNVQRELATGSSTSLPGTRTTHQGQIFRIHHQEIPKQSTQDYILKRECFTPQWESMRGRLGNPITISSGGSSPREEVQPSRSPLKRAGSPSLMYHGQMKRQQSCVSPEKMHQSTPMPKNARQIFFKTDQQSNRFVTKERIYRKEDLRRMSLSPYEQPRLSRVYHDPTIRRQLGNPQQNICPRREQSQMTPNSYRPSPEDKVRCRSLHQAPFHQQSSRPIIHRSASQPLQHSITDEQGTERYRAQSQHRQFDAHDIAEETRCTQAMAAAPENYRRHRNEDQSQNFADCPPSENLGIKNPRPRLGSPLWPNAKVTLKEAPEQAKVYVYGHFVEPAGNRPFPENQRDRGGLNIPFTPPQQRAKRPSVSSQRPLIQIGRSKSVASPTLVRKPQNIPPVEASHHPPSVKDIPDEDSPDGTPLNELLGKQQRQGHMSRNNFDQGSYKAARVLPQDSIFSHDHPKAKQPIAQFAGSRNLPTSPPDIISLIYTPDNSAGCPPRRAVRSVLMKERITPAKKQPAKKSTTTARSASPPNKSTPKTSKKHEVKMSEEERLDPAIIMPRLAADIIITKEIKGADEALDLVLFSEVISQTKEEKQKKEEKTRAEPQRNRLAKEAELQAREEAVKLAEMGKMRVQAEKEEKERLEKEREEYRYKVWRDAERKRRESFEERQRDELRRPAAEKIQADREKAEEEAEERQRLKQEAKERAEKVQAEAEELAKLETKQQEARKQAASPSAAKVTKLDDGGYRRNNGKDKDVLTVEENTLFLLENHPGPKSTDNRSTAKSVGPNSVAEVFAQTSPISAYRAKREETELWHAKLAKKSRLNERCKRQEAAKAMQQAPLPPRTESMRETSKASKAPKKEHRPPKPRAASVLSLLSSDARFTAAGSASQPIQQVCNIISPNSSFTSIQSVHAALPPKTPQQYKSAVKLISQLEREKLEREEYAKRARGNNLKKAARTEQQKAVRRKKDAEKARLRKKQQLIEETNENGIDLSEESLAAQVEEYIIDREAKRQRRLENQARKKKILDFAPDNLALESLIRPQNKSSSDTHELIADDDELTLEEQVRRANEAAMKDSMRALALQRGGAFARAASKKTVADLQSDSESEEDPDNEQTPVNSRKGGPGDGNEASSDSEIDDGEANAGKGLNPDEQDAQIGPPLLNMNSSFARRNRFKRKQTELSSSIRDLIDNPIRAKHQVVMFYTVKKELTSNGDEGEPIVLNQFLSRKEANDFAAARVQEFRQRPIKSISEGIDEDDLYSAAVVCDRSNKNQAYIYVTGCPMSSGDVADFDTKKIDNLLPEKTFLVIQYISQRKVDSEMGEVQIHHNDPELLGHFSRLEMANHEACKRLIALLKPKSPRIEYIEQHENGICKVLREHRDVADQERKMFDISIGPDEEQLQWITFFTVRMAVQLFEMKGPRN